MDNDQKSSASISLSKFIVECVRLIKGVGNGLWEIIRDIKRYYSKASRKEMDL